MKKKWTTSYGDTVEVYSTEHVCADPECCIPEVEYRYRVRARNGEIVEQGSEAYTRHAAAVEAAERHHPAGEA